MSGAAEGAAEGARVIETTGVSGAPALPGQGAGHGPALLELAASAPPAAALDQPQEHLLGDLPAGAVEATLFLCLRENWLAQVSWCPR